MSSNATAATARLITATAKAAAPGVKLSTTSQGPYSYRLVIADTLLSGMEDTEAGRLITAALRELPRAFSVTWGRTSGRGVRHGQIVINVTDEDGRRDAERDMELRRAAAIAQAQAEVASAPLAVVTLDGQDAEVIVTETVEHWGPDAVAVTREYDAPEDLSCAACGRSADSEAHQLDHAYVIGNELGTAAPAQPAAPSSLSAGPAAREARTYAVGGTRGELIALHADPADAIRHAEQVRAAGFGASVYGPCGHPLREYLSRDGVRLLEACRRCVQVQQAADVLRAGGTLTGGLRAAGVEGEARTLLAAEDAAPAVTYRSIRAAAYEVLRDGAVIGRLVRTSGHDVIPAAWSAYLPGGGLVIEGAPSRRDAAYALAVSIEASEQQVQQSSAAWAALSLPEREELRAEGLRGILPGVPAQPAYGCVLHLQRGPECGPDCDRLTAAHAVTAPAPTVPTRAAATVPCWHIETAHGALYGVAATSLRDALQMTQDRLTGEGSQDLPKRGQKVGRWSASYGTVLCYSGPA